MALELLAKTITSRKVANLEKVATGISHTKVLLAFDSALLLAATSPLFGCSPGYEPGLVTPSPDLGGLTEPEKARMESIKTSFIEASEGSKIISGLDKKTRGSMSELLANSLSQATEENITADQINGFSMDEIVPNWTESVGLIATDVSYVDHDGSTKTLRFMFGQDVPDGEWGQVNFFVEGNKPDANGNIKPDMALDVSNGQEPNIWGLEIASDNEAGFSKQLFFAKDSNGNPIILNHSPNSSIDDTVTPIGQNSNFLIGDGPPNDDGTVNVSFKFASPSKIDVTSTPSTDSEPPTPIAEATAMVPAVNISETFKDNQPFYTELVKQDKNASKDIQERGDNVTLTTVDGKQYDVDKTSGGVNVDVNGNPLLVEDTGYINPLTLHGKAGTESEGKVFAFNPDYKGWFEVIQSNHLVDQKASEEEKMAQREIAINGPVTVPVEQVQNGDWAESVLLSGLVKPFPADWKFTGNRVHHAIKDPSTGGEANFLFTSNKIPVDIFGVVNVGGKNIGLRPFQVWNPTDVIDNPNSSEILIANIGIGEERLTEAQNLVYLNEVYGSSVEPILVVVSDKAATQGSGPFLEQSSVLVLKQIPGNDPLTIFFIKQKVERLSGEDQVAFASQSGLDLINIQKLIWLAFFP